MSRSRSARVQRERRQAALERFGPSPQCRACVPYARHDAGGGPLGVVMARAANDLHELVNRSQGGSITDMDNVIPVCRPCHNRIGANPVEAWDLGLHLRSFENNPEGFAAARKRRME